MIIYDSKVVSPLINSNPELFKHFQNFQKIVKDEGVVDRFGEISRLRVFYQIICKDEFWYAEYEKKIKWSKHVPDSELVDLIRQKIKEYGWPRFFSALRTTIRQFIRNIEHDTVNRRRLEKSLEKLDDIPPTVEI